MRRWTLLLLPVLLTVSVPAWGQFSSSTLNGTYAFSYGGFDLAGPFVVSGTITANGAGRITSGVLDENGVSGIFTNVAFVGTYSLDSNGRGRAVLTSSLGTSNFSFVMVSSSRAKFIDFDNSAVGAGEIDKRVTTSFSNAALNGGYAFLFEGALSNGWQVAAGRFDANSAGTISGGVEDLNDTGLVFSNLGFSGSYSVASNGRGTATTTGSFGVNHFAFYVVSPSTVKFISLDVGAGVFGDAEKQALPFSNGSLSGDYAYEQHGIVSTGWYASVGRFSGNGIGGVTGGTSDINSSGTVASNVNFAGSYGIAGNGRGTATFTDQFGSSSHYAFYMVSRQSVKFVSLDNTAAVGGTAEAQQGLPFSTGSASGQYGFVLSGFSTNGASSTVGYLSANAGSISGIQDENDAGLLSGGLLLAGGYSIETNGRGTASIVIGGQTSHVSFYTVSPYRILLAQMDSYAALSGNADRLTILSPVVYAGGLVNGASFAPNSPVAAGTIVSLFGNQLAPETSVAASVPLPLNLSSASVQVNGVPAPLFFVSPTQINFQLPWEAAGQIQVSVTAGGTTSGSQSFAVSSVSPGLFTINSARQGAILISNTDVLVAPTGSIEGRISRPANRGESITIFCTGLGVVTNRPANGAIASDNPLSRTSTMPTVTVGGASAQVSFAGLAPGFVGLYQVNIDVPPNAPSGSAVPVILTIAGAISNAANIAVQ